MPLTKRKQMLAYDSNMVTTYFSEEKVGSVYFIIVGMLSLLTTLSFWFIIKYSFYKGLAYPLLLVGVIQLIVGVSVYNQSFKKKENVTYMLKHKPLLIQTEELPRVNTVLKRFVIYQWVEISSMILGVVLYGYFYRSPQVFWKGFGLGLCIQSGVMLMFNLFAYQRALTYVDTLVFVLQKH